MYLLLTVPESALISSFECRKRLAWKEFEFQIRVTIFCQNVQFSYTFMRASALNIFNIQERPILLVQSLFSLLHSCRLLTVKESLARNGCFFISRVNQSDSSFKTGLTGFNRANVLVSVVFDQSDGVFFGARFINRGFTNWSFKLRICSIHQRFCWSSSTLLLMLRKRLSMSKSFGAEVTIACDVNL